jgi:hypothetical protein
MKIEIPLLAALLLMGTNLLARASVQGVEQALLATAIEHAVSGVRAGQRLLRSAMGLSW